MANQFNNIKDAPGIIAKAAAQTLKDNLVFCGSIDKADASDFNGKNDYKAGDTVYTSIPARYIAGESFDITSSIQDSVEDRVALPLDIISTVGMQFNSLEMATEVGLKNIIKRFVVPAAEQIAMNVESRMLAKATQAVYNSVGTAGSNTFDIETSLKGRSKLTQNLAPMNDRCFLLNSAAAVKAVNARSGLFQSSNKIAEQYEKGMMGMADGFKWYENELVHTHTNGNDVSGIAVNNASVSEGTATLAVDGLTNSTGTVTKGTVFTIAGVNMVHPQTKVDTGNLQQFVVTADATANGSGQATLSISPSIYAASEGKQNVTALPADNAALTIVGAADSVLAQSLQYHKSAFKMVSVPLEMPTNAEFAALETVDGITVAVVRDWDQKTRTMVTRLDFLGGISAVRPEWAVRQTA